jgi:molybdopterin-dependent oxidoreductase alpha subunit
MVYNAATDHYVPISWEDAFRRIGEQLRGLPDPNMAEFYTSGRASNEAAFLYQLFVREYGTNNFPDCSNMCHEATSVGLPQSIGVGKGTVTLEDFDHCDAIFSFGHNPGTNHPRMLGTLREASLRGAPIVVFNPLKERSLERFKSPQSPREMTMGKAVPIASSYYQVKVGGDAAVVKGMMKALLAMDAEGLAQGREGVLDRDFIREHTSGFEQLVSDLDDLSWDEIEDVSGLSRADIEAAAAIYAKAERVILCYGMGITQHRHGTCNVQQLANLLLLRGNIGKEGAGICPLRGHSNVQGDRTVGITEIPSQEFLDSLEQVFGIKTPREHGHGVVQAIEAMLDGRSKALICLGGNFAIATPDTPLTFQALRSCALTVHVTTKLNRSHLVHGKDALILPTLGRTEIDLQQGGAQGVTVEDSMSMVHISYGMNKPASPNLLSEVAIVGGMADAALGSARVDWNWYVDDYARIRDAIERSIDGFHDYNSRVAVPGGFHLKVASREREWVTSSAKAQFVVHRIDKDTPIHRARARHGERLLVLMTTRSHDQYNTTIYGMDDRYRGVFGMRRVLFANKLDLAMLGLEAGQWVDITSVWDDDVERRAERFVLVEYDIPRGCLGAYYPETNPLVPLGSVADGAGTPTSKSIPVLLFPSI